MFISTSKKSPFYQLTYEVDGKRTTVSTKTKNLQDAYKFMGSFQRKTEARHRQQIKPIILSKFKEEYHYCPVKKKCEATNY